MLYPNNNGLKYESPHTIRDSIPNETPNIIHDIVVCDRNDNMLSIPCDPNITFYAFKRANEKYFVPSSQIPVLSVYKLYVVDNHDLAHYNSLNQDNRPVTFMNSVKRYLSCSF